MFARKILTLCYVATLLAACLLSQPLRADPWTASVDERNGLPVIALGGAPVVTSNFVFWGKNWTWADLLVQFRSVASFDYALSGKNRTLNFDFSARIHKPSSQQLVWELELDAATTTADVIGGGMSFRFDLANLGARLGEPELIPGNRGWSWGKPGGTRVEMRFDPPLAAVYFERGQKSEVRALLYQREVPQGQRRHTATLAISGDLAIAPTATERFGLDDPTKWPTDILNWPIAPWTISPVDLSFLNAAEKPAGKRGFVRRAGESLVFEDGTTARFWGTNLTADALFGTDRDSVKRAARRLSELGFNLVRIHHHDSHWVSPNIFGDTKRSDTKNLNPGMLDRLDWWIKCLKDEGIYVWLDLHVQRHFKAADGIDNFNEIAKGRPTVSLKGYNYVNNSIREAMQRFNEAYLDHHNPFTGLRYKDDPAIMALLLTNENDVTHHFGNALLPDRKIPKHNGIYMSLAATFAATHNLPKDRTWRSWEHGPSKLFLNDLENRFNTEMMRHLRTLGAKAPIVTTSSWGFNPLSSLPALTVGDSVDVHSYGGVGELKKNPVYAANMIHWIALAQVVDRPLSVSEWNVERFPVPDRHAIPLYVAGSASLQGWDALMQYAYSQGALSTPGAPSNWHAFNDPALIATLPAAALLYRRGDVREAETTYVFTPTRQQLYGELLSPVNAAGLRTAAERGKLMIALPQTPELPWLEPSQIPPGAQVITDPQAHLIDGEASEVVSDTGELRRNWAQGIYTIDTRRTQAAMGFIGGKRIDLADVDIEVTTRNGTVAVQSLDNNPINTSRALMISLGARAVPRAGNRVPFHSEPVTGRLTIRAAKGLKLYKRDSTMQEREIPSIYTDGRYRIELASDLGTYWLFMK